MVLIVTGGPTQRTIVPWPNPTTFRVADIGGDSCKLGTDSSFLARLAGLGAAPSTGATISLRIRFQRDVGDPLHVVFAPGMGEGVRRTPSTMSVRFPSSPSTSRRRDRAPDGHDRCVNPGRRQEFEHAQLTKLRSHEIEPFRVGEAAATMECRVVDIVHVGREGGGSALVMVRSS